MDGNRPKVLDDIVRVATGERARVQDMPTSVIATFYPGTGPRTGSATFAYKSNWEVTVAYEKGTIKWKTSAPMSLVTEEWIKARLDELA